MVESPSRKTAPRELILTAISLILIGGFFVYKQAYDAGLRQGFMDRTSSATQQLEAEKAKYEAAAMAFQPALKENDALKAEIERLNGFLDFMGGAQTQGSACEVFAEKCEDTLLNYADEQMSNMNCQEMRYPDDN